MESSVSSQKTSKIYSAPLSKLYKDDINVQSELFEINDLTSSSILFLKSW